MKLRNFLLFTLCVISSHTQPQTTLDPVSSKSEFIFESTSVKHLSDTLTRTGNQFEKMSNALAYAPQEIALPMAGCVAVGSGVIGSIYFMHKDDTTHAGICAGIAILGCAMIIYSKRILNWVNG